jgi:arginyl-tRNA synthetase
LAFLEFCLVLKAEEAVRGSRLALCDLTARVLKQGLDVLGIEVVEQM